MKLSKSPKGLKVVEIIKNVPSEGIIADLYDTRILEIRPGYIKFNSGGWRTMHTKKCMNLVLSELGLPAYVRQKGGVWYVEHRGQSFEFKDGYVLSFGASHESA